jgi:hypothetical protein
VAELLILPLTASRHAAHAVYRPALPAKRGITLV